MNSNSLLFSINEVVAKYIPFSVEEVMDLPDELFEGRNILIFLLERQLDGHSLIDIKSRYRDSRRNFFLALYSNDKKKVEEKFDDIDMVITPDDVNLLNFPKNQVNIELRSLEFDISIYPAKEFVFPLAYIPLRIGVPIRIGCRDDLGANYFNYVWKPNKDSMDTQSIHKLLEFLF